MTIDEMITEAANKYGLDAGLLRRQFKQESGLNPDAVSPKGALGVAQVMPKTGKALGYSEEDLKDPAKNIDAGAKFMAQMYEHARKANPSLSGKDLDAAALAAYNAGPSGALKYIKSGDTADLVNETRTYINKILSRKPATQEDSGVSDIVAAFNKARAQGQDVQAATATPVQAPAPANTVDSIANAFLQAKKEQPASAQQEAPQQSSLTGYTGAVTRGLAPTAAGATLGAIAGAPLAGVGAVPGALAGAGAGFLTQVVGDPAVMAVNKLFGTNYATPSESLNLLLDKLGVARPETGGQELAQAVTSGLASGGLGAPAAAQTIAKVATSPVTKAVATQMAANPAIQAISGGTGAAAADIVRQEGGNEWAQMAAGLLGGLGGGVGAAKAGRVVQATQAAKAAKAQPVQIEQPIQQEQIGLKPEIPPAAESPAPAKTEAVAQAVKPKDLEDLSLLTKKAITKKSAQQELAVETMPDAETVEAAKRLGISEHLQPDHVTTSQSYRELSQAIKSFPGSELRAQEIEGLKNVANRANKIIEDAAGTKDISELSANVKNEMAATQQSLENEANKMYKSLRERMPANADAPADNVLAFISKRAEELGGVKNLSPMEKMIYTKLKPKTKTVTEVDPIMAGSGEAAAQKVVSAPPSYALLDDVRRDLTAARVKKQGVFKDADTGLIKVLESKLKDDQGTVLARYGLQDDFSLAQKTVALRKSLEDDMTSLFGKELQGNIVSNLQSGVKGLAKGDTQKLEQILKSVPENMRENVATSGLSYAFGKNAADVNFNSYANWYEGLKANKQAFDMLSKYISPDAMKNLDDFYKVSNGIRLASRERIQTGRLNVVKDSLKDADTAIGKIYESAKGVAGKAIVAEIASSSLGAPGAGLASGITAALVKEKVPLQKAADKLMASDEFKNAVKAISNGAAKDAKKSSVISKVIESTPEWKEFFAKLPKEDQEQILKTSVVQWLVTPKEKEKK